MEEIKFLVQGSSLEPYTVRFVNHENKNLSAYCNCMAGENGQYCKHRFNILDGNTEGIISTNLNDVKIVSSWFHGSDIEEAIVKFNIIEKEVKKEVKKLKNKLDIAKKEIVKAMLD